jgi:glycosyltransferase involved in cell wall biosynthesis
MDLNRMPRDKDDLHQTGAGNAGVSLPNGRPLRIAQLAPLHESVPPKLYGGTERVVAYLAEELARRGHEITLFASGDSTASVRLKSIWPVSLRLAGLSRYGNEYHLMMISEAYQHAEEFDLIHSHLDFWNFPMARLVSTPTVATAHGRLDHVGLLPVWQSFRDIPMVSISDHQRTPLPAMNWVGTVYHGLPRNLLRYNPKPGKYLAFLGRMSREKGPDVAIEVAQRAGIPLKMAAKVDENDREYFQSKIKPLLSLPGIEYVGEITEKEKSEFLGEALALLFPVDWPEPFGLAVIEALACGTPVIARPCGSVPELIRDGVTGLLASDLEQLVAAVERVSQISREACRADFESRFTVEMMATNYEQVYRQVLATASDRARLGSRVGLEVNGSSHLHQASAGRASA